MVGKEKTRVSERTSKAPLGERVVKRSRGQFQKNPCVFGEVQRKKAGRRRKKKKREGGGGKIHSHKRRDTKNYQQGNRGEKGKGGNELPQKEERVSARENGEIFSRERMPYSRKETEKRVERAVVRGGGDRKGRGSSFKNQEEERKEIDGGEGTYTVTGKGELLI